MRKRTEQRAVIADSGDEAHRRIVATVRFLLDHGGTTQSELAELLDCDPSSINRALLLTDTGARSRRREWRASEVYTMAVYFDLPVEVFYGTNIEEAWEQQMAAARLEHARLLRLLDRAE